VYELGAEEADRHKWIESEKAGVDLGETAISCWIKKHWNGFLRHRWIEHLYGERFWHELRHDDFGLLRRAFQGSALIGPIMGFLKDGQENLDILNWAIDRRLSRHDTDEIIAILTTLDINSRRLECRLCRSR
jgi:hypothetical protein